MRNFAAKTFGAAFLALALCATPLASAWGLTQYYTRDQYRNPSASKFTPKRFGYMPSRRYLPGTAKVKKKCIPNGQARCIARPERPNPYASRLDAYNNQPKSRSGSTASPVVKTFDFENYVEEN